MKLVMEHAPSFVWTGGKVKDPKKDRFPPMFAICEN
jgi:hypothetical protein